MSTKIKNQGIQSLYTLFSTCSIAFESHMDWKDIHILMAVFTSHTSADHTLQIIGCSLCVFSSNLIKPVCI